MEAVLDKGEEVAWAYIAVSGEKPGMLYFAVGTPEGGELEGYFTPNQMREFAAAILVDADLAENYRE